MGMSVLDEVRNKLKEEEDAVLPEPSTSSRPRKSQSSVARRRTAFKSASRSQQSGAIGLIALAGGAFFLWRWWKNRQSQPKNASGNAAQQAASTSGKGKQSKGSAFSFDRKDKKAALKAVAEQPSLQAVPSKFSGLPPSKGTPQPVQRSGNPKKDKRAKQNKKAAKEKESKEAQALGQVIASRAQAKGIADAGKEPEVGLHTVVDYNKTADAFHHVAQWQESGRKQFK